MINRIINASKANANEKGVMEQIPFQKRASLKSLTSRGNFFLQNISFILLFAFMCVNSVELVRAQRFDCKKDVLDGNTTRFSQDPSTITIGQRVDVSVFNRSGKKVVNSDFMLSSDNKNARTDDMSFYIENKDKGDAWVYFMENKPLEMEGSIKVFHKSCDHSYSFAFKVRQPYVFENTLNCQGEKRELAVAKYKNTLNKNLYVVIDINQNQVFLLEAPLTIDGSGIKGADGMNGADGQNGRNGLVIGGIGARDGSNGTDGGDGGDGGNGGNGGEIKVYVPQQIARQVSIKVDAGQGGQGGQGGKGGQGGRSTGNGRAGRDGRDGRNGQYGQNGVKGNYTVVEDDEILNYFKDIRHPHFKIENIDN